jgi:hypothetical protein
MRHNYFYFPQNAFISQFYLFSVQIVLINHVLKFEYQHGHLKVNMYICVISVLPHISF